MKQPFQIFSEVEENDKIVQLGSVSVRMLQRNRANRVYVRDFDNELAHWIVEAGKSKISTANVPV